MTTQEYSKDETMLDGAKHLEKLALTMGFQHEDIILFKNLTSFETLQALVYGL